ncbi:MAG: hypothetical protein HQ475_09330 [SAR202 cluster bacterium]|nr:hypothetical protein [SAR202 cluster bacterium]
MGNSPNVVQVVGVMAFFIILVGAMIFTMVPDAGPIIKEALSRMAFALFLVVIGSFLVVIAIAVKGNGPVALIFGVPGLVCWVVALKFIFDSWSTLKPLWEALE